MSLDHCNRFADAANSTKQYCLPDQLTQGMRLIETLMVICVSVNETLIVVVIILWILRDARGLLSMGRLAVQVAGGGRCL